MDFTSNSLIPIFPLGRVVFPDSLLRLQIFEQRYLDMVSSQLAKQQGFGVCLIKKGFEVGLPAKPFTIGTYVEIIDFSQNDSGILNIVCQGTQRFQINNLETMPNQLLTANVSWLEPLPEKILPDGEDELRNLLKDLSQHPQVDILDIPDKWNQLGFVMERLSEFLPIQEKQKQAILEISDLNLRQTILYKMLHWLKG
ncbi:MAG: LON peptidase substrate-binding domain-containing protein [Gammaproteobacteria bacterium]|nr:LON peptidase substrate-binding domain-containing protein [Gammaproteobacteria bacterium]